MRLLNGLVLGWAVAGLCLAGQARAADLQTPPRDVALRDGGVLVGQVVNAQGVGMPGVPVSLRVQDQWVTTKAGEQGYFAFKGMQGGVHQIAAGEGHGVYRLWSPGTAPPAANEAALVIADKDVVRGAFGDSFPRAKAVVTHPLFIAGAVATAVAVPLALSNHHEASP